VKDAKLFFVSRGADRRQYFMYCQGLQRSVAEKERADLHGFGAIAY
jgi:hypothetical protein